MSEELMNALAEKLNIAVDGAAGWLGSAIPQYCQARAFNSVYLSVVFAIIFFCCVAAFVFFLRKSKEKITPENYWCDMEWTIPIVVFGVAAVLAFLLFTSYLTDCLTWTFYPDGMLLKSLIS
jgi:amino acid transporter